MVLLGLCLILTVPSAPSPSNESTLLLVRILWT